MATLITAADRASFRRCRREWDLGARSRQDYEPLAAARGIDVAQALNDALAVYYFPGMWDWDRSFVQDRTVEAFHRSLHRQRQTAAERRPPPEQAEEALTEDAASGEALLARYFVWAPGVDRFAPIRVASDYEVLIEDPDEPERGLADPAGSPLHYAGRVDLLIMDAEDRYWVMRHRTIANGWSGREQLRLDDRDVADCWAWQASYPGLEVAGTVSNELWIGGRSGPTGIAGTVPRADPPPARSVHLPQHEPSGGGRTIGTHRRAQVACKADPVALSVEDLGPGFRRTWIGRTQAEIAEAGRNIGLTALDMVDQGLRLYPTPAPGHCPSCAFRMPCMAMNEGADADAAAILARDYRKRPPEVVERGRLGGVTWGLGRGAAPPPDPTP
ncbi:MAG: hypothetical protein M3395_06780 [Chloroflexota bacterium]|nr:hypothetical protein [Chloroflexota bacterium]